MAIIDDYPNSYPVALTANLKDNNMKLFESIMPMKFTPDMLSNIRKYLGNIYINGKSLADTMSEDAVFDDYMNVVRAALAPESNDYVTIMNRNSIFPDPRPVILENSNDPAIQARIYAKNARSLKYTENYREDAYNMVKNTEASLAARKEADAHLFFDFLFYNEDGSLKSPDADPKNLERVGMGLRMLDPNKGFVSNISPGFVLTRQPENAVYAYMFTKDYPEGSGRKMTYERLMTEEDTQQFRDFKKKIGKEFCDIFFKPREDAANFEDYAEHFNTKTFPAIQEITKALMNTTANYHDLSDKDNLDKAVIESQKNHFMQDMSQQIPLTGLGEMFTSSAVGITRLQHTLLEQRLLFISSNVYRENQDLTPTNSGLLHSYSPDAHFSVYAQALADNSDVRSFSGTPYGGMGSEYAYTLNNEAGMGSNFTPYSYRTNNGETIDIFNEMNKFRRGEPNVFTEEREKEVHKVSMKRIARDVENIASIDPDDYAERAIEAGNGYFLNGRIDLSMDDLQKLERGETIFAGTNANDADAKCNDYEGLQKSLLTKLVGCPFNADKSQLMAAVNTIYINDKSMAEYFGLNEDNIVDEIRDKEKELATLIRQSVQEGRKEFVYIKTGKDTFNTLSLLNNNKEAIAYMRLLNGVDKEYSLEATLVDVDLAQCVKDAEGVLPLPPGMAEQSYESAARAFAKGENNYGDVLKNLLGRDAASLKDLETAGKDIYIGDKPLSEIYNIDPNKSIDVQKQEMGKLLHDTFMAGINGSEEPKPITYRNKNGMMEGIKLEVPEVPEKPIPVKPLSGFKAFFSSPRTIEQNRIDVANYVKASHDYINAVDKHDRFAKYNEAAEKARLEVLKTEKDGPAKRTVSIQQMLKKHGTSAAPALTQPVAERRAERSAPSMNNQ